MAAVGCGGAMPRGNTRMARAAPIPWLRVLRPTRFASLWSCSRCSLARDGVNRSGALAMPAGSAWAESAYHRSSSRTAEPDQLSVSTQSHAPSCASSYAPSWRRLLPPLLPLLPLPQPSVATGVEVSSCAASTTQPGGAGASIEQRRQLTGREGTIPAKSPAAIRCTLNSCMLARASSCGL